jgi:hypothetical protein
MARCMQIAVVLGVIWSTTTRDARAQWAYGGWGWSGWNARQISAPPADPGDCAMGPEFTSTTRT